MYCVQGLMLMLIMTMPAILRAGGVVSAPSGIELPGLVAHYVGDEESDGSGAVVRESSLPEPYKIDLDDPLHAPSEEGAIKVLGGFPGQYLQPESWGNQFAGGDQSWIVIGQVKLPTGIANGLHVLYEYGVNKSRGQELSVATDFTGAFLTLQTYSSTLSHSSLTGPQITLDEWWTIGVRFDYEALQFVQFAVKGAGSLQKTTHNVTARDVLLFGESPHFGGEGVSWPLLGLMRNIAFAKGPNSAWDDATILAYHNEGTPRPYSDFSIPDPLDFGAEPWSNLQTTANFITTATTSTAGLYFFRPYWIPSSGNCRWFWSTDHAGMSTSPSVWTATSAGPGTAPATKTAITLPVNTTLGGLSVDHAETIFYKYVAGDANGRPHYLYANYVYTSPATGEVTMVFSSAVEDFATFTFEGIAVDNDLPAFIDWTGYCRVYDSDDLPGITGYHAYSLANNNAGQDMVIASSDPKTFDLDDRILLDSFTAFPAFAGISWKNLFSPDGVHVYAVDTGYLYSGSAICLIELEQVDGVWCKPTGTIWKVGDYSEGAFPTLGHTQGVMIFFESGTLYIYRLRGYYPDLGEERVDLITIDF